MARTNQLTIEEPDYLQIVNPKCFVLSHDCIKKISNAFVITLMYRNKHTIGKWVQSQHFGFTPILIYIIENSELARIIDQMEHFNVIKPNEEVIAFINQDYIDHPYIVSYNELDLSDNYRKIYNNIEMFIKFISKLSDRYQIIEYGNLKLYVIDITKNINKYSLDKFKDIINEKTKLFDELFNRGFGANDIRNMEVSEYLT